MESFESPPGEPDDHADLIEMMDDILKAYAKMHPTHKYFLTQMASSEKARRAIAGMLPSTERTDSN